MLRKTLSGLAAGATLLVIGGSAWAEEDAAVEKLRLPRELHAGFVEAGYVSLDKPAGENGVTIYFAHSGESDVQMPAEIYIKPGDSWGRFPIRVGHHVARRSVLDVAAATKDGGVGDTTRITPAPMGSHTILQRGVTVRYQSQ